MLEMGVFEGRYLNDCTQEFPSEWFQDAKPSPNPDPFLNYFGVKLVRALMSGGGMAGYMDPIHAGGFNGIADTIQAGGFPRSTTFKSGGGEVSHDMPGKYGRIAIPETFFADPGSAKPCCNGRMTLLSERVVGRAWRPRHQIELDAMTTAWDAGYVQSRHLVDRVVSRRWCKLEGGVISG